MLLKDFKSWIQAIIKRYYVLPVFVALIFTGLVFISSGIPQRYNNDLLELVTSYTNEIDLNRECSIRGVAGYKDDDISYEYIASQCIFGSLLSVSPEILLLGDSHANHFKPFIVVLAKEAKLTASYHVQGSCSAVKGVGNIDDKSICAIRNRRLLSYSGKYNYVVLGGAWAAHGDPRIFKSDLVASIETVVALEATPVVIIDAPASQIDKSKCPVYKRLGWTENDCDIPIGEVYQSHHEYDDIIKKLSLVYPQLIIINPKNLLCNNVSCRTQIGNVAIYRDTDHINEKASRLLARNWEYRYGNPF